ncbi:MAG: hypothetical protein WC797_01420 [Candidatus Paceibacterota bacterium]|jgi:hypothetical protein
MIEQIPSFEITRSKVIEMLREKGVGDFGTREVLLAWVEQQEKIADKADQQGDVLAKMRCAADIARVYGEAGYLSEAIDELESTLEGAVWEQGSDDFCTQIRSEIDALRQKIAETK